MPGRDRALVGLLAERLLTSTITYVDFEKRSGVSRSTIYRVIDGDPRVTTKTLRKIETSLGLPFDTLQAVTVHDWPTLRRIGVEEGLVQWLEEKASQGTPTPTNSAAKGAPSTSTTPGKRATSRGGAKR